MVNEKNYEYTEMDKACVMSSNKKDWYNVTPSTCDCYDFVVNKKGSGVCKHMEMVYYSDI